MKRVARHQRRALDRLLRRRAQTGRFDSPEEYLRRIPIREGPPAPPVRTADPRGVKWFRQRTGRWFLASDSVVPAHESNERDLVLLVGSPPELLAAIERVERATGRAVRDVWPSFRGLLFGGVDFAPFAEPLRLRGGPGIRNVEVIQPIEGVTLAVDGRVVRDARTYFEFLPEESEDAVGLAHVREGVVYRVLVTTGDEVWRRDGGQLVRFESLRPLRVAHVGNRFDCGAFGERLLATELEGARGSASGFRLIAEFPTATQPFGRYRIEAEFDAVPPDLDVEARRIDDALSAKNDEYRRLREQGVLRAPFLRLMPRGTLG
jgi:hypothetical protein